MNIRKWKKVIAFLLTVVMAMSGVSLPPLSGQVKAAAEAYTIRVEVPDDWLIKENGTPYIYIWNGSTKPAGEWPGAKLELIEQSENLYGFQMDSDLTSWNMIISNRDISDGREKGRTDDINEVQRETAEKSIYNIVNKKNSNSNYKYYSQLDKTPSQLLEDTSKLGDYTMFVIAPSSWSMVGLYAWITGNKEDNNQSWPGVIGSEIASLSDGKKLYGFNLDQRFSNIIINNGDNALQTADIKNVDLNNGKCWLFEVFLDDSNEIERVEKLIFTRIASDMIYIDGERTFSTVYDGTEQSPSVTLRDDGQDVPTDRYNKDGALKGTEAGTYTVTVAGDDVYYIQSASKTWTITPKPLTIKAKDQTVYTGASIQTGAAQVEVTGLVTGDELTGITLTPDQSTGTITPSGATTKNGAGNYTITYQTGLLASIDHEHDWKYAADGNVIEAWCEGPGDGCDYIGTGASHANALRLTLTAPAAGSTYDGATAYAATVVADDGYPGMIPDVITYTGTTSAGTSYNSTSAPKEAGSYTASVTANEVTAHVSFTVLPKTIDAVPVTGLTASLDKSLLIKEGDIAQITVTVTPENADNKKVKFTSSDDKVATVDANGKVTAVANGKALITVSTEDGSNTAKVELTVAIPDDQQKTDDQTKTDEKKDTGKQETAPSKQQIQKNEFALNAGLKVSQTGSKITVKWGKVSGVDGYDVFAAYCGNSFNKKNPTKTAKKSSVTSVTITKLNGKKLKLTKNYKIYVAAYKMINGKKVYVAESIHAHIVGVKNTKYTNVKSIKLSKSKYTLKVGGTAVIKAKTVLVQKDKKQLSNNHATEFRYASTNKKIAVVDKNGNITAKAKGTCTIYVYARNGYAKKVKVTVK